MHWGGWGHEVGRAVWHRGGECQAGWPVWVAGTLKCGLKRRCVGFWVVACYHASGAWFAMTRISCVWGWRRKMEQAVLEARGNVRRHLSGECMGCETTCRVVQNCSTANAAAGPFGTCFTADRRAASGRPGYKIASAQSAAAHALRTQYGHCAEQERPALHSVGPTVGSQYSPASWETRAHCRRREAAEWRHVWGGGV